MLFLTSVACNNWSKFSKFRRCESINLIIFRSPSIKSNFEKLSSYIFLNYIADSPITLIVLSINEVINVVNFPQLLNVIFGLWLCLYFSHDIYNNIFWSIIHYFYAVLNIKNYHKYIIFLKCCINQIKILFYEDIESIKSRENFGFKKLRKSDQTHLCKIKNYFEK